jgi:hypothetical protein
MLPLITLRRLRNVLGKRGVLTWKGGKGQLENLAVEHLLDQSCLPTQRLLLSLKDCVDYEDDQSPQGCIGLSSNMDTRVGRYPNGNGQRDYHLEGNPPFGSTV